MTILPCQKESQENEIEGEIACASDIFEETYYHHQQREERMSTAVTLHSRTLSIIMVKTMAKKSYRNVSIPLRLLKSFSTIMIVFIVAPVIDFYKHLA